MTHEEQALWQRIRHFGIDAPGATLPFSVRLAREQGWTPGYADRVVEEYRRFAFLAVAAGHGVTPSKAVDEAWHLHLLYTRSYWEEFCPKALGRPLHHHPADGGLDDETKYAGWYEATLASYGRMFGESPPADVWPREPARTKRRWAFLAALPLLLGGCTEPANPLDWHGPEFLVLFAVLYVFGLAVALLTRHLARGTAEGPKAADWRLHVYDQASLNGGAALALATAISRLAAAGTLEVAPNTGRMRALREDGDHPLDRAVLRAAATTGGAEYATVRRVAAPTLDEMETSLRRQGLWTDPREGFAGRILPFAVACVPLLLGLMKILVGMGRDRPVGFLVLGCALGLTINLLLLSASRRSRYGDRVLQELRASRPRTFGGVAVAPGDLAFGVALYGVGSLDAWGYGYLRPALMPPADVSGGAGGDSGGCGSSGCGGGGCGGGGCGGCGS